MSAFLGDILSKVENLLRQNERILGSKTTNILRSFIVIIGGRYGIGTTNSEWYQILFAVLYFFSPIDLIPDFIPFIGYIDDIFVLYVISKSLYSLIQFTSQIINLYDQRKNKINVNYAHFEDDGGECGICYGGNGPKHAMLLPCKHKLCESDTKQLIARKMNCPFCRGKITGYSKLAQNQQS